MAGNVAKLIVIPEQPDFIRASGAVVCPKCGAEYFDHPYLEEHHLYVSCDGTLLHL